MAEQRRWVKNIRTGLVFPVNPQTFSGGIIDPDLVPCRGPQDETPVRPIIHGVEGVDMSKWIDPNSRGGKAVEVDDDFEVDVPITSSGADVSAEEVDLEAEGFVADPVAHVVDEKDQASVGDEVAAEVNPTTPEVADSPSHEQLVMEAMATLDPADPAHFTKAKIPDARALSERCGFLVTAELRDRCWAAYQESSVPK